MPKADKKPDQEFRINGHASKSFQRQDAINPVAGSWAATWSVGDAKDVLARARGTSKVLCVIPTLEKHHTEDYFKKAVAPVIWEHEIDQLLRSPMSQLAHWVWYGQFQTIKATL